MKTKISLLAALLIGGLIFTSCKKDNSIEQSFVNTSMIVKADTIMPDIIQNYPDPFYFYTNIVYKLDQDAFVKLSVYDEYSGLIDVLVNEFQGSGVYKCPFSGSSLAPGKYFVDLRINGESFVEVMTRSENPPSKNDMCTAIVE